MCIRDSSQDEDQTELNNVIKQLMLKHKNERVGIFCTGDYLAIKTYNALLEASADAPKNFGVIGFDGLGLKAADNSTPVSYTHLSSRRTSEHPKRLS